MDDNKAHLEFELRSLLCIGIMTCPCGCGGMDWLTAWGDKVEL